MRIAAPQGRPVVVAHRGASDDLAEHTLGAYRRAIEVGADALECDVRLTSDGVLVCVHDRRIDRTSDGRGAVAGLKLAELADLDFGSWHRNAFEAPDIDDRRVLTLERLLEVVVACDRRVGLAIETKHPSRHGEMVELRLSELLVRFGLHRPDADGWSPATVMSFAATSLRRMRRLQPEVPTVYLMQRIPLRLRDGILPGTADGVGPSLRAVRAVPSYVERVHAHGGQVLVWTVDAPEDIDFVTGLGVDAVVTNRPGAALAQLTGRTQVS